MAIPCLLHQLIATTIATTITATILSGNAKIEEFVQPLSGILKSVRISTSLHIRQHGSVI